VLPNLVKETEFNAERIKSAGTTASARAQLSAAKGEVINYKALNYTALIPVMIKPCRSILLRMKNCKNKLMKGTLMFFVVRRASHRTTENIIKFNPSTLPSTNPLWNIEFYRRVKETPEMLTASMPKR
jgi:hypothetical protein